MRLFPLEFQPRCFLPCAKTPTVRLRLLHSTAPFKLTPINKMKISKCIESNFYIGSVKNILGSTKLEGFLGYSDFISFTALMDDQVGIFAFIYQRKKKSRRKSLRRVGSVRQKVRPVEKERRKGEIGISTFLSSIGCPQYQIMELGTQYIVARSNG